jgi:hypothetical protein
MKTRTTLLTISVIASVSAISYMLSDSNQQTAQEQSLSQPKAVTAATEFAGSEDKIIRDIGLEVQALLDDRTAETYAELPTDISTLEIELSEDQLVGTSTPWSISSFISTTNTIELDGKIQVMEPIEIDTEEATNVSPGDVVLLPLPGADQYRAVVDRVTIADNGETSWNGYIEGYGSDYPVTFTVGAQTSFATITTPEGLYAMEAVNNNGWVYKTPDLVDLVDPDQPDHLVVEHP